MHYSPRCAFGFGMFPVGQNWRRSGWQAPIFGRIDISVGGHGKEWTGRTLAWTFTNGELERRVPRKHRRTRMHTADHPIPRRTLHFSATISRTPQRPEAKLARWLGTCSALSRWRSGSQIEKRKKKDTKKGSTTSFHWQDLGGRAFQEHGVGVISCLLFFCALVYKNIGWMCAQGAGWWRVDGTILLPLPASCF